MRLMLRPLAAAFLFAATAHAAPQNNGGMLVDTAQTAGRITPRVNSVRVTDTVDGSDPTVVVPYSVMQSYVAAHAGSGGTTFTPDTTSICLNSGTLTVCYGGLTGAAALQAPAAAEQSRATAAEAANAAAAAAAAATANAAVPSVNFATLWATQFTAALGTTAGKAYPGNNPSNFITAAGAPLQSIAGLTGSPTATQTKTALAITHSDITDWNATIAAAIAANPSGFITASGAPVQSVAGLTGSPTAAQVKTALAIAPTDVSGFNSAASAAAPVQSAGSNCTLTSGVLNCASGLAAPSGSPNFIGFNGSALVASNYTPLNAALLNAANGVAGLDNSASPSVFASQLGNVPTVSYTNLNTSTYNPGALTAATFTLASTNADALGMDFMQFPGAHMDGVGNDCPAWNEAVAAVNQQWNQFHLATPIVLPMGHGRLYLNCTGVTQPAQGVPLIVIGPGGHNSAVVQLGAAFNGSWITWSNVNIGTWPNIPGTVPWDTATNAGPRVTGVTCAGVRPTQADPRSGNTLPAASTVVQNCYDLRDDDKQGFFDDDDCYELPGSCIRTGYTLYNTSGSASALTDETDFKGIRMIEVGLTAAASPDGLSHPPIDMSTSGSGDAFNQIFFDKIRITRAYSECGFWMHNNNTVNTGSRQVHGIAIDIEDTFAGSGFCFGSPTDTGPTTFACDQCVSLGAHPGGAGVSIINPPNLTGPNQSQGISFTNFTSIQTNEGPNVDVEGGMLHHFDFQKFTETQWTPWAAGGNVPANGADVSYGNEGYQFKNTSNPANSCTIGSTPPAGRGTGTSGTCTYTWVSPSCSVCAGVLNPQWATSTAYAANSLVNDNAIVWKETVASCTSASSGSGPTAGAGGAVVTDGSCSWTSLGPISISGSSVFTTNGNDPGMGAIYTAPGLPATTLMAPVLQTLAASVAGASGNVFQGTATIQPGGPGNMSNPLALSSWAYLQKVDGRGDTLDFQSSSDNGVTFHDAYTIGLTGAGEGTLAISDILRGTVPLSFGTAGNAILLAGSSLAASPSTADNSTKIATTAMVQAAVSAGGGSSPVGNFYIQPGTSQGGSTVHVEHNTGTTTQSATVNFETWDSGALTSTDYVLGTKAATGDLQLYASGFASTPFFDLPKSTGIGILWKGTLLSASPTAGATDHELVDAAWVSALYAPLASPTFTGTPAAPTQSLSDSTTALATDAFVKGQAYAPLASPALTGAPTAPTQSLADSSTDLATDGFVKGQAYAPLASPALTGAPTAPNQTAGDNSIKIATTAYVATAIAGISPTASCSLFTASGTWTKATTSTMVAAWSVGGGGGGGAGAALTGSNSGSGGAGGGGGLQVFAIAQASQLPSTLTVTIGAGGAAATSVSTNGSAGGDTTLGSLFQTARGGGGGGFGASAAVSGGGGGGGIGIASNSGAGPTAGSASGLGGTAGGAGATGGIAQVAGTGGGGGGSGATGASFAGGSSVGGANGGAGGGGWNAGASVAGSASSGTAAATGAQGASRGTAGATCGNGGNGSAPNYWPNVAAAAGGGSGGGCTSGVGGTGGAGGLPGGGGGGGGAGTSAGPGGAGGSGEAMICQW